MLYRNTKTQAVLETTCGIKGGDWVLVEEEQPKKDAETPKKKRKKSGD